MKKFFTGILAGIAVGYLTAPGRGEDMRKKLTDELEKRTQGIKDQWDKTVTQAQETIEKVKKQVEDELSNSKSEAKKTDTKASEGQPVNG